LVPAHHRVDAGRVGRDQQAVEQAVVRGRIRQGHDHHHLVDVGDGRAQQPGAPGMNLFNDSSAVGLHRHVDPVAYQHRRALFPQPAARARLHNAAVAEHDAKVASDGANNNPFLHTTPPSPMLRRDGPSVRERLVHAHHAAHVHLQARCAWTSRSRTDGPSRRSIGEGGVVWRKGLLFAPSEATFASCSATAALWRRALAAGCGKSARRCWWATGSTWRCRPTAEESLKRFIPGAPGCCARPSPTSTRWWWSWPWRIRPRTTGCWTACWSRPTRPASTRWCAGTRRTW